MAFQAEVKKKFGEKYVCCSGSPFKKDENNSEYIVKSLSNIIKTAENDKVLVANSLNGAVETALFDLFNKFFIKRDKLEFYRVAM